MSARGYSEDSTIDAARSGSPTVPHHPLIGDRFARAVVDTLVDCDSFGVALLRGAPWVHAMVNAKYQAIVGTTPVLGLPVSSALPESVINDEVLSEIQRTGKAFVVREAALGDGLMPDARAYASFTFLRVSMSPPDSDAVLVIARDVIEEVHERRTANLFVLLAEDLATGRDAPGTVRNAVTRAVQALDADVASIFLLSPDGTRLDGALVGWDWTRASFSVEVATWPTVKSAIEWEAAVYLTRDRAQGLEAGWFERRGIVATICAPMCIAGRVVGVLFFDFDKEPLEAHVDLAVAKGVADQCALVLSHAARPDGRPPALLWQDLAWTDDDEARLVRGSRDASEVLAGFLAKADKVQPRGRDRAALLDEAVVAASVARDLLAGSADVDDARQSVSFADVASIVRSSTELLRVAGSRAGVTVLSWTPAVALAMIGAPIFEEAFQQTATDLVEWAGSGGHLSINVLAVGANVEIVFLATAPRAREAFQAPLHARAIIECRGGSVIVEPDEGTSVRITIRLPGSSSHR